MRTSVHCWRSASSPSGVAPLRVRRRPWRASSFAPRSAWTNYSNRSDVGSGDFPDRRRALRERNVRCGSIATYAVHAKIYRCPLRPGSDRLPTNRDVSLRAMCGRLRVGKGIFTSQAWSVQPCVRPLSAVHMTAGHNALRGSGPGQKLAFDNALALLGCPDRRIDRLCITCCSPLPTFTSRRMVGAISFTPRVRLVLCNVRPWPSSPTPSWRSCLRARWLRPSWVAASATR